jgi:HK97 family phage prohead protease
MSSTAVVLKSIDDRTATIEGYAVVFGGQDLDGEHFEPSTNFWLEYTASELPVLYEHGLDETIGRAVLGRVVIKTVDDLGLWVQAEIDRSRRYAAYILELIKTGRVGWSTGTVPHLVEKVGGMIRSWPLVECSLTPTPCEPRTLSVRLAAKSIAASLPSDVISPAHADALRIKAEYDQITALRIKAEYDQITAAMDAMEQDRKRRRRAAVLALKGDIDDLDRAADDAAAGVVLRAVNPYDVPEALKTAAAAAMKAAGRDLGLPPIAINWWREETAGDRALKADARRALGREPWPASVQDGRILGWITPGQPTVVNLRIKPSHDPAQIRYTVRHELRHVRQALDGRCTGVSDWCQRAELEADANEYAGRL